MTHASVTKPYQKRRRYSKELKTRIVAECLVPGASVSRISLDHGLNANMVGAGSVRRGEQVTCPRPPGLCRSVCRLFALHPRPPLFRISVTSSVSRFPVPVVRWWWSGLWSRRTSARSCCEPCWNDPHRRDLAGDRTAGHARRARQGPGARHPGLWRGQAPLRLPVCQQTRQSDESVDSRWPGHLVVCPPAEPGQVPLGRVLAGSSTAADGGATL